jgi:predicted Rossmann fold nucleotide-binding protein DprA/Smf involved in DNA uptake
MVTQIPQGKDGYPPQLTDCLGKKAPAVISLRGNQDLWFRRATPLLALVCSRQAPGSVILQVHDLAQGWRTAGGTVISGFHSPAEREALVVLLRGPGPVIVCPARSIVGMRLKPEYKEPLATGRLLLVSPFGEKVRRIKAQTATARNRFAAALADQVLIAHAQPGGKAERLAQEVVAWGKPLYTLEHPANEHLLALGADLLVHTSG